MVVDLAPRVGLKQPVTLAAIKAEPRLAALPLIKQSRLSVMPIDKPSFDRIVKLGGTKL